MVRHPLAVQMYTLRNDVANDYPGTLRAVAELGYQAVELATLGGLTAATLRTHLDALGLHIVGMHIGLEQLEHQLDQTLDDLTTLGVRSLICPWLPPERRSSAAHYRAIAHTLNQIGRTAQERGIQLCYHHHDFEFQPIDSSTGMAILLEHTDPTLLHIELDVYWAAFAGIDPIALIRQLAGRVALVHLKDMAATPQREFAEVGHGTLDMPHILAACDHAEVAWLIVEQDTCARPPLESIRMSLDYLRTLGRA